MTGAEGNGRRFDGKRKHGHTGSRLGKKYANAPRVKVHGVMQRMLLESELNHWRRTLHAITTGIQPIQQKGRKAVV